MTRNEMAPDDQDACLLSFSLGPVQPFIAAARSVRDLWTGSYLLSWLTYEAMRPILERCDRDVFATPSPEGISSFERRDAGDPGRLPPACLPNRFLAVVPATRDGETLAGECERRCHAAWKRVADAVHRGIDD